MTPETDCLDDSVAGLPLCIAAARGDLETMKLLLKHGADAKLTDWNGNSVLSCLFVLRRDGH
jgi:ankyrin repeat protein